MQSFVDRDSKHDVVELTVAQIATLKAALEQMLEERREHLQQSEELFRTLTADRGAPGLERESARVAAEDAYEAIQETNLALQRITDGTFGTCMSCQMPIPFERLEALPRTETCVRCPDR